MKLDLEDDDVFLLETTATKVRDWFDEKGEFGDDLETALDEAQGSIRTSERKVRWVVIKVGAD